jgi:hypothetical protein
VQLSLRQVDIFEFAKQYTIETYPLILPYVNELWDISESKILDILLEFVVSGSPNENLQLGHLSSSPGSSQFVFDVQKVMDALQGYDYRQIKYLNRMFHTESALCRPYFDRMVVLYADYMPTDLQAFLQQASTYNYPRALKKCEEKGIFAGVVHILQMMGNSFRAAEVKMCSMRDVKEAIRSYEETKDESLLFHLLSLSFDSKYISRYTRLPSTSTLASELMLELGTKVDPLLLVKSLKRGRVILSLKPSIVRLLNESRLHKNVLQASKIASVKDNVTIMNVLVNTRRRASRLSVGERCFICSNIILGNNGVKFGAGSEDPTGAGTDAIVVFICGHGAHERCLQLCFQERAQLGMDDLSTTSVQVGKKGSLMVTGRDYWCCLKCRK